MVLSLAPGGFLARWNPSVLDEHVDAARDPVAPAGLRPGLAWLRAHTPPGSVCISSPEYAAEVALTQRTYAAEEVTT